MNAPMTGVATVEMAAAAANAGGVGLLAAESMTPEEIAASAKEFRRLSDGPLAMALAIRPRGHPQASAMAAVFEGVSALLADLGLPDEAGRYDLTGAKAFPDFDAQFRAALEAKPAMMLAVFGGFREPEADALKAAGILNAAAATTLREAKVLRAAGADLIVCQGAEAGGPRAAFEDRDDALVGISALLPHAVKATGLPVVAAGGISCADAARGLKAMGASGVLIGTALAATEESAMKNAYRRAFRWAGAADLATTRIFAGRLERVLRGPLLEALESYESVSAPWPAPKAVFDPIAAAAKAADREELFVLRAGQSVGRSGFRTTSQAVSEIAEGLG